jgi:hypothetical protein
MAAQNRELESSTPPERVSTTLVPAAAAATVSKAMRTAA